MKSLTKRGREVSGMAVEGRAALQAGRALALLAVPGDLLCPEQGEGRWRGEGRCQCRASRVMGDIPTSLRGAGPCDGGNKQPSQGPHSKQEGEDKAAAREATYFQGRFPLSLSHHGMLAAKQPVLREAQPMDGGEILLGSCARYTM